MTRSRRLSLSREAEKFLADLQAKQFKQVMLRVLALARDATPHDSESVKGYPGRRIDVGEYRVIYRLDLDTLFVEVVAKRNDDQAYRILGRS